jgi:single-stranded DNA-binding protein
MTPPCVSPFYRAATHNERKNYMTRVEISGNLTRDPEIKTSDNGTKYTHVTIASDRGAEKDAKTDFLRVTAFGDDADALAKFAKGSLIKVAGYLRTSEFEGRTSIDIIVRHVQRIPHKSDGLPL